MYVLVRNFFGPRMGIMCTLWIIIVVYFDLYVAFPDDDMQIHTASRTRLANGRRASSQDENEFGLFSDSSAQIMAKGRLALPMSFNGIIKTAIRFNKFPTFTLSSSYFGCCCSHSIPFSLSRITNDIVWTDADNGRGQCR